MAEVKQIKRFANWLTVEVDHIDEVSEDFVLVWGWRVDPKDTSRYISRWMNVWGVRPWHIRELG